MNRFSFKIVISTLVSAVLLNIILLDFFFITSLQELKNKSSILLASDHETKDVIDRKDYLHLSCPNSCLSAIKSATASSTLTINQITSQNNGVKEYFIPLGTGSTTANTWTGIASAQAYIDSSLYPSIQQVVFEATISIPTGNQIVWARLYNVTAQHPVWNSEVQIVGGAPQLLISAPINLDQGNNLYQVQMQTQLQYPANLNEARVHITLQ